MGNSLGKDGLPQLPGQCLAQHACRFLDAGPDRVFAPIAVGGQRRAIPADVIGVKIVIAQHAEAALPAHPCHAGIGIGAIAYGVAAENHLADLGFGDLAQHRLERRFIGVYV